MNRDKVEQAVWDLAGPICSANGVELVAVERLGGGGRQVMRLSIDKPGGVTLDDCERISYALDQPLERADPVAGRYYLEVSSPGLDRPLQRREDIERFAGRRVRIRCHTPVAGRRKWTGELKGAQAEAIVLVTDDGQQLCIPFESVQKARLIPEADVAEPSRRGGGKA